MAVPGDSIAPIGTVPHATRNDMKLLRASLDQPDTEASDEPFLWHRACEEFMRDEH